MRHNETLYAHSVTHVGPGKAGHYDWVLCSDKKSGVPAIQTRDTLC